MNWMGGVRNRLKVKNERKRQQDFFEKKKFTSKVRKIEIPASPSKQKQAVSLDLISLQAANFSAAHFKKNGSGIRSSSRINRVDLDKSRGLFRQKFVNIPDASPELKPSALDLSKPSPQKSTSSAQFNPSSRRHTLSSITDDNAFSVIGTDCINQDLHKIHGGQREQPEFWTSTPANFWHKKKRSSRHNVTLDSEEDISGISVKREPPLHSPSTAEKLLLDSSREQMRALDDSDYWGGKTPASSISVMSDLSTIMEDTDEATVPSMDNEDWDYPNTGTKWMSSQSYSESVQSHDVPLSQWTLQAASEEQPLLTVPDSTLSSFKDCHKIEYPIEYSSGHVHEQYSNKTGGDCLHESHLQPAAIITNHQPRHSPKFQGVASKQTFNPTMPRDHLHTKKSRKGIQIDDQPHSKSHSARKTNRPMHESRSMKESRDLACHESTCFTSPEDNRTYLMTERAKISQLQDSTSDQKPHTKKDPLSQKNEMGFEDVKDDRRQTNTPEMTSFTCITSEGHDQVKNVHWDQSTGNKFLRRRVSAQNKQYVNIMNLSSHQTKQICKGTGDEKQVDAMKVHTEMQHSPTLIEIKDDDVTLLVNKNASCTDGDEEGSMISDVESSVSDDCSSTDDSPEMDLPTDTDVSSVNWLEFVHDVPAVRKSEAGGSAPEIQQDDKMIKFVPATAQQMLDEVLALDRQLCKENMAAPADYMKKSDHLIQMSEKRTIETLSDNSTQSQTDTTLLVIEDTCPVQELKTLLSSSKRNPENKDMGIKQQDGAQDIDMKATHEEDLESCNISSSRTEGSGDESQPKQSGKMSTTMCGEKQLGHENGSIRTDFIHQRDIISTTTTITDQDPVKSQSSVPTSTSIDTAVESKQVKVLCDISVQCTLIGEPLPEPKVKGIRESVHSLCIQSSSNTGPSVDDIKGSSACDSVTDTQSSIENDFESCSSSP